MNDNRNLHAIQAATSAANEVIPLGLVQRNEVLSAAPVSGSPLRRAVVVPRPVHLEHVVLCFLVPKCCILISDNI